MYEDKTLVCKDCGAEFIFSAGEQEFYAEKGFQNEPIRCKACRNARKSQRNGEKEMYDAVCAQCGAPTKIPFVPKNDRPIYCSACFQGKPLKNASLSHARANVPYYRQADISVN